MTQHTLARDFQIRATPTPTEDGFTFTGVAVPWDSPTRCFDWWDGAYEESFERGAVQDSDDALIFWRHSEPIGKITAQRDTDEGWEIDALISKTPRGIEAATLLRDGVIDRLSIGFEPLEKREVEPAAPGDLKQVIRTKVRAREVSLVPFPAYDGAKVSEVREEPTQPVPATRNEDTPVPAPTDIPDLTALTERFDDFERNMTLALSERGDQASAAPTRTAGEALQSLVRGDSEALEEYNQLRELAYEGVTEARAYTGSKTADSVLLNSWVGDLTRLAEEADPLRDLFSTGTLPATGMTIEYGQLKSNTVKVEKQSAEGADLAAGKVQIEPATAKVETFGGYTELTRQVIERSSVSYLDTSLRALAIAAGKSQALARRAALAEAVAAQITAANTVDLATNNFVGWFSAIVDATEKYEDLGLSISQATITADKATFKALGSLTDTTGRPLFVIHGSGVNAIGSVNPAVAPTDLDVSGVRLRLNTKQAAAGAAFTHPLALRTYNSPVVSLQDSNIINLSQQFSVYYYGAYAHEIPAAIIPVVTPAG